MIPAQYPQVGLTMAGWHVLAPLLIWAIINCFLGYFIFRILLVGHTIVLGAAMGVLLAAALRPSPTPMDYLVACSAMGVICGMVGWFFFRLAFAAISGVAAAGVLALLLRASLSAIGASALGVTAGLALAAVSFAYTKHMVIFLAGVSGGFGAVFAAVRMFGGQELPAPAALVLLTLLAASLSAAGMFCQVKITHLISSGMTPQAAPKTARPSTQVHPRFTKV